MAVLRSACPSCGAGVEFRSAGSVQTVCEFCKSILVRSDVDLAKVGEVAELPPIVSPIQIGTEGVFRGRGFVVVGRIVYEWEHGGWNEWHIVFNDGRSGWLSDAQAEYAISIQVPTPADLPPEGNLYPGAAFQVSGQNLTVTTRTRARYVGVEGELPFQYWNKAEILFIDFRSSERRFATVDYSEQPPLCFVGEAVDLPELRLTNLRDMTVDLKKGPLALVCPNCGAGVEKRLGQQSASMVCAQCLAVLDSSLAALKVLQTFSETTARVRPQIPLGTKGRLHGDDYEICGFQVRTIEVEDQKYAWDEYVLFNPMKGFRYLSCYNGHWNDIKPVSHLPQTQEGARRFSWMGRKFQLFQRSQAQTRFVLGEFPWRVRVGETVAVNDYVSPPMLLSQEKTANETAWSVGEYVPPAKIWESFKLPGTAPAPVGVFANQPSPFTTKLGSLWAMAIMAVFALLLVLMFAYMFTARDEVFSREYTYVPGVRGAGAQGEASFVTPVFDLRGRTTNVEVRIETDLNNSWLYFNLALIDDKTGQTWDWGREVSKYSDEGSRDDTSVVGGVPAGRYYLRVEPEWTPESASSMFTPPPVHYTLKVRRDVPRNWYVIVAILLALLPPVLASWRAWIFESQRWNETDEPMIAP